MPQNLREKLALLLDDAKSLSKHEALDLMEAFFRKELHYLETEHLFGNSDLLMVKHRATQFFMEFNPRAMEAAGHYYIDQDLVRALAYSKALNEIFRSKGLMSASITYDKNKR